MEMRKPYLLVGSDNLPDLEDKVSSLWSFGYRPHGNLVYNDSDDLYNLIQPLVYSMTLDERIGESYE